MGRFSDKLAARLVGVLRWSDLDALWARVNARGGWFAYMPGEPVPDAPLDAEALAALVSELDGLLRREHEHDYCGIVYADDLEHPTLVKVYDPGNLGASCGTSGREILPRWILSLDRPEPIGADEIVPGGRSRWWRRLLGGRAARDA
jgi:hypothetical protein